MLRITPAECGDGVSLGGGTWGIRGMREPIGALACEVCDSLHNEPTILER